MNGLDDFLLIHSPGDYELWMLCKKIFKTHFAQCHTAWKRDFAF